MATLQAVQSSKIKPLGDRILLKPIEAVKKIGAIYLPDNQNVHLKVNYRAKVIELGTGRWFENGKLRTYEFQVKVGDVVLVDMYGDRSAGTEINYNGEKLVLIKECLVGGIVTDPDKTSVRQAPDFTAEQYDDSIELPKRATD